MSAEVVHLAEEMVGSPACKFAGLHLVRIGRKIFRCKCEVVDDMAQDFHLRCSGK